MSTQATVVLVHGAFHGAWCWKHVEAGLVAEGVRVVSFDLPGHGDSSAPLGALAEDADAVRSVLELCTGDIVLCGHSYGGAVMTEAVGRDTERIRHLVYLTAAVPDIGESILDCFPGLVDTELDKGTMHAGPDGTGLLLDPEQAWERFYADCDPLVAEWALARIDAQDPRSFLDPVAAAPWREVESTYAICTEDLVIPVGFQQRLAKRCHRSLEWVSSHSPMLSRPERVIELLAGLAS